MAFWPWNPFGAPHRYVLKRCFNCGKRVMDKQQRNASVKRFFSWFVKMKYNESHIKQQLPAGQSTVSWSPLLLLSSQIQERLLTERSQIIVNQPSHMNYWNVLFNNDSLSNSAFHKNKSVVFLTGAARSHRCRRYIFTAEDILSRRDILVTPAQCTRKYITYTCTLAVRYFGIRYARLQRQKSA